LVRTMGEGPNSSSIPRKRRSGTNQGRVKTIHYTNNLERKKNCSGTCKGRAGSYRREEVYVERTPEPPGTSAGGKNIASGREKGYDSRRKRVNSHLFSSSQRSKPAMEGSFSPLTATQPRRKGAR